MSFFFRADRDDKLTKAQEKFLDHVFQYYANKGDGQECFFVRGGTPTERMARRLEDRGLLTITIRPRTLGYDVRINWDGFYLHEKLPYGRAYITQEEQDRREADFAEAVRQDAEAQIQADFAETVCQDAEAQFQDDDEVRDAVVAHLHWKGVDRWRLTDSQWRTCYYLADGFGSMTPVLAHEQCWDWSHVRDSTDHAFREIWKQICEWQ